MICLISCDILESEVGELIDAGSIEAEPWFLDAGLHCDFDELEEELRRAMGEVQKKSTGAVVVYGDLVIQTLRKLLVSMTTL